MAETQKGGAYIVGDKVVDAYGNEVKMTSKAKTEPPATEVVEDTVYVEGVKFGSEAAGLAAKEAGLTAADFNGYTASGQEGYTKPDVAKVIASKQVQ